MRNSRRLAVAASAVIATGSLIAGTAGGAAAAPATAAAYSGRAEAEALKISLFGKTVTASAAVAELANSLGKASISETLGQTSTFSLEGTTIPFDQTAAPEKCTGSELTQVPGINRFDVTCGSVAVKLLQDAGSARALGSQLVLEPSVAGVLSTLQLQEPVQAGANQLFEDAINPLVQNLTGNPVGDLVDDTTATVQDVLNKVLSLSATARVVVAPALAEVNSAGDTVTSHARSQGIRIELLPLTADAATNGLLPDDLAPGEPLLTITIGNAEATKTVTKGQEQGAGKATAALAKIEVGSTALTDALGLPSNDITIEGGQSICLLPAPLETCVNIAAARVDANGDATADGASVHLFKGVNGGVELAIGRATTAGTSSPLALPALDIPRELPRTGGPATLPLVGGGLLALAAATRRLSLRRR